MDYRPNPTHNKYRDHYTAVTALSEAIHQVTSTILPEPPAIIPTFFTFRTTGADFLSARIAKLPQHNKHTFINLIHEGNLMYTSLTLQVTNPSSHTEKSFTFPKFAVLLLIIFIDKLMICTQFQQTVRTPYFL